MATRHTTDFTPNPRLSMNIMRFWENLATYLTSFGGNFSHNFIPLSFLSPAGGPARRIRHRRLAVQLVVIPACFAVQVLNR